MVKQKVVVKVTMKNAKKSRKAMKIAVSISGVESATFLDKEQIMVTGERIDSFQLTCLLRKSVGHTELVSVGPVEEKQPPKPQPPPIPATSQKELKETVRCECVCREPCYGWQAVPLQVIHEVPSNTCSIL